MCDKDQFSALCYFLIHVNDMPMAAKCNLFLYADDTCLFFLGNNVKDIEK